MNENTSVWVLIFGLIAVGFFSGHFFWPKTTEVEKQILVRVFAEQLVQECVDDGGSFIASKEYSVFVDKDILKANCIYDARVENIQLPMPHDTR